MSLKYLKNQAKALSKLSDQELRFKDKKIIEKKEEEDFQIKKKYWVK